MSFKCQEQTSSFTDTEVNALYQPVPKANPGLLGNASITRDSNGMISSSELTRMIASLKKSGVIPDPHTAPTSTAYMAKVNAFLGSVQNEYCWYESRYKYVLNKLFSTVQQGYRSNSGEVQMAIQKYLKQTQDLNKKLNDLTQMAGSITDDILASSDTLSAEVAELNAHIQDQKVKLDKQNKIISSGEAAATIRKEMVRYTEEKARHSDNLLKMYGFLNIVVLGLLVYVYKAASD